MGRERMCQFGNCNRTDTAVTVNYYKQERPAFCCGEHAALWLLGREERMSQNALAVLKAMSETVYEQPIGVWWPAIRTAIVGGT